MLFRNSGQSKNYTLQSYFAQLVSKVEAVRPEGAEAPRPLGSRCCTARHFKEGVTTTPQGEQVHISYDALPCTSKQKEKSRIRETLNFLTNADNSTDTIF